MKTINSLQAGRAIAALAVVVHHTGQSTNAFSDSFPRLIHNLSLYGYLGVDFFFVLSGFIIYYTSSNMDRVNLFFGKRLRRIFIPYLPVGLTLAIAYTYLPEISQSDREWSWLATITLLPHDKPTALSVAWTLQHEMIFYAIFALCLLAKQVDYGMYLWALIIIAVNMSGLEVSRAWKFFTAPINLEFVMGVVASKIILQKRAIPRFVLPIAAMILFFIFFAHYDGMPSHSVIFGLGVTLLVINTAHQELDHDIDIPRTVIFLGAASYSIYLIHYPFLAITSRILGPYGWPLSYILGFVIAALAGCLYHLFWEKPMLRILSPKKARKTG